MRPNTPHAQPPPDFDVPAVPLSVALKYRHRQHAKGSALGYLAGLLVVLGAVVTHNPVLMVLGVALALGSYELGKHICQRQGCKTFRGRR